MPYHELEKMIDIGKSLQYVDTKETYFLLSNSNNLFRLLYTYVVSLRVRIFPFWELRVAFFSNNILFCARFL